MLWYRMSLIVLLLVIYLAAVSVGCMIVSAGYVVDGMRRFSVWDVVDPRKDLKLVRAIFRLFKLLHHVRVSPEFKVGAFRFRLREIGPLLHAGDLCRWLRRSEE